MASKTERQKRKALLRSMREADHKAKAAKLPLPPEQLKGLFDFVDERLRESACDQSLRHTMLFLETQQLPKESVLKWLRDAGGYCDCEVIANAEEEFQSSLEPTDGRANGKAKN